jgi:hypothetical protein
MGDFLRAQALHAGSGVELGNFLHQLQLERGVVVVISFPELDAVLH